MLWVCRAIDFLIEASKLLSRQDVRELAPLLGRLEPAYLPDLLRHIAPPFVIQSVLADQAGDPPDQTGFHGFRNVVLRAMRINALALDSKYLVSRHLSPFSPCENIIRSLSWRPSEKFYSPRILISTRFGRLPSNSP